jgi:hypothetical protein
MAKNAAADIPPQRLLERDTGIEPAEKHSKTIENTTFSTLS